MERWCRAPRTESLATRERRRGYRRGDAKHARHRERPESSHRDALAASQNSDQILEHDHRENADRQVIEKQIPARCAKPAQARHGQQRRVQPGVLAKCEQQTDRCKNEKRAGQPASL
jgi:hypothetical protein